MALPEGLVTPRRLIVVGASLAALLLVIGIGFSALTSAEHSSTPDSAARGSATPTTSAGPTPSSSAGAIGPTSGSAMPPTAAPRTATEVLADQTAAPTLPPSAKREPLVSAPLPPTASAAKKLVAGFPAAIALKPKSTIVNSSVSSSGGTMQATLSAKTEADGAEVIAYYEKLFAKIGLAGSPVPSTGGTESYSFARGNDSVTLTVTPSKSNGSSYALFGVLNVSS